MQENYTALLKLPIVSKLVRKNARLERENRALKSLIYSLPEFRCECRQDRCRNSNAVPLSVPLSVPIKKEKEETIPVQCETLVDDDVVFVSKEDIETKKENIVYEIDEEDEEEEEEAATPGEDEEAATPGEDEEEATPGEDEEEEDDEAAAPGEEEEAATPGEEEEEEEEEAVPSEEVEEEEVFAITISGKSYYTTNKENGKIYAIDADEEIGDEIGEFKNGKASFYKK